MPAKLLISGEAGAGKTSLIRDLKNALVISHDGKPFPFPIPYANVETFGTVQELIELTGSKLKAYSEKFGKIPDTIVFDSVSKIFDTIMDNCNRKYSGFAIFNNLNAEVNTFTDYIQNTLIANGLNVVIISHAIWDSENSKFNLIGKGDFGKRGSFYAEVDNAVFVEAKSNKRLIHHRGTKFPARTLLLDLPDTQNVEEYDLQKHIDMLNSTSHDVKEFEL